MDEVEEPDDVDLESPASPPRPPPPPPPVVPSPVSVPSPPSAGSAIQQRPPRRHKKHCIWQPKRRKRSKVVPKLNINIKPMSQSAQKSHSAGECVWTVIRVSAPIDLILSIPNYPPCHSASPQYLTSVIYDSVPPCLTLRLHLQRLPPRSCRCKRRPYQRRRY